MSRTTEAGSRESVRPGDGSWTLVIMGPDTLRAESLGTEGAMVIGRDVDCEIRIDHARVSRRHARLHLGTTCVVEDLGSRNGTRARGARMDSGSRVELGAGEPFGIGPFTCVLVAGGANVTTTASTMMVDDPSPAAPPALLVTVARSPLTVLIRGETGAGKEVLAETLHRLSDRAGRLVRINCASLPGELLESELFGHERGAFTGAVAAKQGLLEAASGGTVFLDEIGEMPLVLQAKLLRAIEAGEVVRVGGTEARTVDVRFVAATNRDLPAEIARGAFRLDLYYRLAVLTLTLPPLRERPERLPALATRLLAAAAERTGDDAPTITPAAMARLQGHAWPGNVRELRNVIERALLLGGGGAIGPEHIILDPIAVGSDGPAPAPEAGAAATPGTEPDAEERQRLVDALAACAGNQTRAAKMLGISRATLANKLVIHRIPRPRSGR